MKHIDATLEPREQLSPPHTGAWIETAFGMVAWIGLNASPPHTGAWIETKSR